MENNEIKVSRIPKPFSIESLISKQSELSSPPSPQNCSKPSPPPSLDSQLLGFNPANYHPAMLPFPLYSNWFAGYLSQQQQQQQPPSERFVSENNLPQNLPPNLVLDPTTNYLLAHHKDQLSQFLSSNTNNGGASHNNNKLSELFSDFSSNERAKLFLPNFYRDQGMGIGVTNRNNENNIERDDSCSSPDGSMCTVRCISRTPSPDESSDKHLGNFFVFSPTDFSFINLNKKKIKITEINQSITLRR